MEKTPGTEPVNAPATMAPRQLTVERQGARTEPIVFHFPQVRGGVCEFCGTIDPNVEPQYQYKLCPHYRGLQLRCSYCPEGKNPDDVVYHSKLNITSHPNDPSKMVVCCDSYDCTMRHQQRFQVSG